jgi:hypothetical protein
MAPSDRSVSTDQAAPRGRSFFADVCNQTLILTKKNFLVQGRSTTALLTQLFIGVIFLAILRLMQFSIETNPGENAAEKGASPLRPTTEAFPPCRRQAPNMFPLSHAAFPRASLP